MCAADESFGIVCRVEGVACTSAVAPRYCIHYERYLTVKTHIRTVSSYKLEYSDIAGVLCFPPLISFSSHAEEDVVLCTA